MESMFSVHVNDGQKPIPDNDICYIIGKDGIYLKKKLGIVESCTKVDKISILNDVETYGRLHLPKIPGKMFARVFGFFREAYLKYKGESAIILCYHDETKKYKIEVPVQEVSGAAVHYEVNTENKREDGYRIIGTIHSHANFGAFHSGVDVADEKSFDGLHITIGHVAQSDGHFTLSTTVAINGARFLIESSEYIEGITPFVEYKKVVIDGVEEMCTVTSHANDKSYMFTPDITDEDLEFSPKWMEQVSERKYTYTAPASSGYGGYDWSERWWQQSQPSKQDNSQHRWWERYNKRHDKPQSWDTWDDYTGSILAADEKTVESAEDKWYNRIAKASAELRESKKPSNMSKKEWKWLKKNHNKIEEKMSEREKELETNPQLNLFSLDPRKREIKTTIPCTKCIHRDLVMESLQQTKHIEHPSKVIGGFQPMSKVIQPGESSSAEIRSAVGGNRHGSSRFHEISKMVSEKIEARKTIRANFPDLSDKQIEDVLNGIKF